MKPTCDKKLVVYYEVLQPMLKNIQEVCIKYDIEWAMMFRTDELEHEPVIETKTHPIMVSYGIKPTLSKATVLQFIEMLVRRQRGAEL
jgi:hypothetical protein